MSNISLVTVTSGQESAMLQRQLDSCRHFIDPGYEHIVIINDDIKFDVQGQGVRVVHKSEVPGYVDSGHSSSVDHQTLTLLAANLVKTDYYIMYDSKNYLTKVLDLATVIENDLMPMIPEIIDWTSSTVRLLINSYELMGLDAEIHQDKFMAAVTPFMFKREYVLRLLDYLKENNIILEKILSPTDGRCSEFYLYSAYCNKIKAWDFNWLR
jgi:hypothetical protein